MTDAVFVDTNILIYARDSGQRRKQLLAMECLKTLWHQRAGRTSMQVLSECYVTMTRKLNPSMNKDDAWDYVQALMSWNPQPIDRDVVEGAREIERRYRTSWWDALIVSAAQTQHCKTLLSEDFQNGMVFGQLKVQNPFAEPVGEPPADYSGQTQTRPLPRHRARGRPAKSL
jgi:predicted nucleic acid-binding protein